MASNAHATALIAAGNLAEAEAVLLELALTQFAVRKLIQHGFTLHTTPDLAKMEVLEGTGYQPRCNETQIYSIAGMDLSLVATAEITLVDKSGRRVLGYDPSHTAADRFTYDFAEAGKGLGATAAVLTALAGAGAPKVTHLAAERPDLETVFLTLTGKRLRD